MVGNRFAIIDLPEPGGPIINIIGDDHLVLRGLGFRAPTSCHFPSCFKHLHQPNPGWAWIGSWDGQTVREVGFWRKT